MADIIHFSPARQNQIYFDVEIDNAKNTLTIIPKTTNFLNERTGMRKPVQQALESSFHAGLAAGCLVEWLDEEKIKYTIEERFENLDNFFIKVTLQ
jgi:hypothetical protein